MDPGQLGVFIPIIIVAGGVVMGVVKVWTQHEQQMATIRSSSRVEADQSAQSQFDELRNEISQLRDTTTKYDMSVEGALQEVRHRLTRLESRNGAAYRPAAEETEQQAIISPRLGA